MIIRSQMWLLPGMVPEMPPEPTDNDSEHWSDIEEFPGYQCSTLGRFRNGKTGQVLRGTVAHNGYVHIGMSKDGVQTWRLAHRVIAEAFLDKPQPDNGLVVNHINQNRSDNRACNLEWVTRSENAKHWIRMRG